MASSRLSKLVLALAAVALGAAAQAPTRLRGTVSGLQGEVLSVRDAGAQTHRVRLGEKTEIVYAQPIALADIKPGDFLAVTSVKRPDGTLTALEVRRFPKPVSPGHRPFDGREDQTMTNATLSAMVGAASGRVLTLDYPGGEQKVVLPESASISTLVPGARAQLVAGAPVNLTMNEKREALRIQVGAPPPK